MLLVDGPARGTVVSFADSTGHRFPFTVEKPQPLGAGDMTFIGAADATTYHPQAICFMGHRIWVGVCGREMPPETDLFDLMVSATVKQCAELR